MSTTKMFATNLNANMTQDNHKDFTFGLNLYDYGLYWHDARLS